MNKNYIDTHMHINSVEHENWKEIIERAYKNGVNKQFLVACEKQTIKSCVKDAKEFEYVYPVIGLHPTKAEGEVDAKFIEKYYDETVVAIGEIGLDLHYDDNPTLEIQIKSLEAQIEFANSKNLPVVIHSRDADAETFKVLTQEKFKDTKFLLHSYAYGSKGLQKYIDHDFYFSLSGIVTFKNAHEFKEAAKLIPLDKMVSETDSPYLAPVPHRGKTNEPSFVIDTVKYISELRGIKVEELVDQIQKNVKKLFGI
ncbi:MAG: TatD family hydrolase [Mycoplasma sp.]|nr:TatD family hydrolase [Mycoplasma sp.]